MWFVCAQFKCQTVLFDPLIGPYQVLPFWVWVDLGAIAMKVYFTVPRALRLDPDHQMVLFHIQDTRWGEWVPSLIRVGVFYLATRFQNLNEAVWISHFAKGMNPTIFPLVGWGCRTHRLHLWRGIRYPPPITSLLDMTLNNLMGKRQ